MVVAVAWSWLSSLTIGWRRPSVYWSSYGSTLMKVIPGSSLATALTPSRVGPHWAVRQKAGVAKTRTNGLCPASAWSTEVV